MGKIVLRGTISPWDLSASSTQEKLDEQTGDVEIEIDSFGGDFYEGMSIFAMIREYSKTKGQVTTIVNSKAMSSGSHIFLAGDIRKASANATIMCHNASSFSWGDSVEMEKQAKILSGIDNVQSNIYAKYQNKSVEEIRTEMKSEMWYIGKDQLLTSGLISEIIDDDDSSKEEPIPEAEKEGFKTFQTEFRTQYAEKSENPQNLDKIQKNISACIGECKIKEKVKPMEETKETKMMTLEEFKVANPNAFQAMQDEATATAQAMQKEVTRIAEINALSISQELKTSAIADGTSVDSIKAKLYDDYQAKVAKDGFDLAAQVDQIDGDTGSEDETPKTEFEKYQARETARKAKR